MSAYTTLHYTDRHVQQLIDVRVVLQDGLLERQDTLLCSLYLSVQVSQLGLRADCIYMAFLMLHQFVLHWHGTQLGCSRHPMVLTSCCFHALTDQLVM